MASIHQFPSKSQEPEVSRDTSMRSVPDVICAACGTPAQLEPQCDCGRLPDACFMRPKQAAERAIKLYPKMSDRAIADKFGVSHATVSRIRATVSNETVGETATNDAVGGSTVSNEPVEKRIGKDGKKRRAPRKKEPGVEQAQRSVNATPEEWKAFKNKAEKEGSSAAAKLGELVSGLDDKLAEARELGRQEILGLLDETTRKNFTEKGKMKIDDAIRIYKKVLNKQYEQKINEEVRRRIEIADEAVRASNKKLHLENVSLLRMISQRGVFSETQYKQMLMLCHPDSSASPELKAKLLQILVENKARLIKEDK